MAGGQLSRAEALQLPGCRHACHILLYADTDAQLFGSTPIRHIILMQMRFDGLLGFPGGFVNPSEEDLEAGLSRELWEELGVELPVSVKDHMTSCHAPSSSSSHLITHFYAQKMGEAQIRDVERAAATTATDHGQEVMGMVRVPLYTLEGGGGLPSFLSHSFVGNSRSQLLEAVVRLRLVGPEDLSSALALSLSVHTHSLSEHTHSLSEHTHSLSVHTHLLSVHTHSSEHLQSALSLPE